jgi:hypothetical protein
MAPAGAWLRQRLALRDAGAHFDNYQQIWA